MSKKCYCKECYCKKCCYQSKKNVKESRKEIVKIIIGVCSDIKEKHGKGANFQIVGSAKKNLVVRKGLSHWDIDFQIVLVSHIFFEISPADMKNNIFNFFKARLTDPKYSLKMTDPGIKINMTPPEENKLESFDIATMRHSNNETKLEILRGITNDKNSPKKFRWEESANKEYYSRRKEIKDWDEFRKIFLNKKCENYDKLENQKKKLFLFI